MEIGRVCVKLAGRDAGRVCVVVDQLDGNFVLIDGNVRRKRCNAMHLEPLAEVLKLKKNASHADVATEFKKLNLEMWHTKPKKAAPRTVAVRKAANANKGVKPKKTETPKSAEPKKVEHKKEAKPKAAKKE